MTNRRVLPNRGRAPEDEKSEASGTEPTDVGEYWLTDASTKYAGVMARFFGSKSAGATTAEKRKEWSIVQPLIHR